MLKAEPNLGSSFCDIFEKKHTCNWEIRTHLEMPQIDLSKEKGPKQASAGRDRPSQAYQLLGAFLDEKIEWFREIGFRGFCILSAPAWAFE